MKYALKHLQSLVAVALCVVMAVAFTGCSDDDDEPENNNSLAGTTWTILSDVDDSDGEINDEIAGITVTFQKDGNLVLTPSVWSYAKWAQNGNTLKLTVGEGSADDYMEGTFTINGKQATYKYSWYDCGGNWGGEDHYTMTLQKK